MASVRFSTDHRAVIRMPHKVMGEQRSGRWSNALVWAATVVMAVAAVALLATLL
jgi:anti-sigma-K factor RskA